MNGVDFIALLCSSVDGVSNVFVQLVATRSGLPKYVGKHGRNGHVTMKSMRIGRNGRRE